MKTCSYHRWQLERALDGGAPVLPPRTLRHLTGCASCAAAWESLRQVDARLRFAHVAGVAAAPALVEAVRRRLAAVPSRERPVAVERVRLVGALGAAAAALVVAGVWFGGHAPADRPAPVSGAVPGLVGHVLSLAPQWLAEAMAGDDLVREGQLLVQDVTAVVAALSDSLPALPPDA
jgi:hypothetical protein